MISYQQFVNRAMRAERRLMKAKRRWSYAWERARAAEDILRALCEPRPNPDAWKQAYRLTKSVTRW
jgi:hypothetical protein